MGGSVSNFLADAEDTVRKPVKDVGKGITQAVGYGTLPMTAPFAYLGGAMKHGWKGGESGVSALARNPNGYYSDPRRRGEMAIGVGTAAAVAGGAALGAGLAGGATVGTGEVVGWTAGGAAIEGSALSLGGAAAGLGGAAVGAGAIAGSLEGAKTLTAQPELPPEPGSIAVQSDPVSADLAALASQRQRRGRAGTILTSGQTLGGTTGGKTLLGQ
jgi:hypothetical protein